MGGRKNREIRDQDVQGLKCLRKIRPLLSRLWNAINATVTHANDLTEADRAASVISDEIVELGW